MRTWIAMFTLVGSVVWIGCDPAPRLIALPPLEDAGPPPDLPPQVCTADGQRRCVGNKHYVCTAYEEFLETKETDCSAMNLLCHAARGCIACSPGDMRCKTCTGDEPECTEDVVQACNEDGTAWQDVEQCDLQGKGEVCSQARCQKACEVAKELRGYVGCEFYSADLDNAALSDMNNASAQQYAVAVANPNRVTVDVSVELNTAPYGSEPKIEVVERRRVAPGDLDVFRLPRREVDGSSGSGLNDGTHTAVTSNAYRITSVLPITAYQFNPLENVNVFSNDASLLYPISALGSTYTVVGWPQTISDSSEAEQDFDSSTENDDLRVFLTVLGTRAETKVNFQLGSKVVRVVGGGPVPESRPGDSFSIDIGPFDVINLETQGLNADFTGTRVDANHPVAVFVGSEASDVPMFDTYAKRQCCADHLEEQLLPDTSAGTEYVIGRMPQRTIALNAAAVDESLGVANKEEPEWVRVVAIADDTRVQTTLAPPDHEFVLDAHQDRVLVADKDIVIRSSGPIQVLQALGSQGVTGIPRQYPGGDPSIIAVPPVQQYRRDYIFLTPDKYLFDFVTITAPRDARIRFDGGDLPESCVTSDVEGFDSSGTGAVSRPMNGGVLPVSEIDWVVHRCQLAFPEITKGTNPVIEPGVQHDGVHTIVSDREVAIIVYGFDRFVSYAYVGGLDFDVLQ